MNRGTCSGQFHRVTIASLKEDKNCALIMHQSIPVPGGSGNNSLYSKLTVIQSKIIEILLNRS